MTYLLRDVALAIQVPGTGDMAGALLMRTGQWINRLRSPEHPPALADTVDRWIETSGPTVHAQARADGLLDQEVNQ